MSKNNKAKQKDRWRQNICHYEELDAEHSAHQQKIEELQKEFSSVQKLPSTEVRIKYVFYALIVSGVILFVLSSIAGSEKLNFIENIKSYLSTDSEQLFSFKQLFITAPILFIVWMFRDQNRLNELHNKRKDTNLKEFQKLQEWATGNVPNKNNDGKASPEGIALQISALHALRPYLKGEFGEDFRRGTFEIYASTLQTQHQKIQQTLCGGEKPLTFSEIKKAISKCELTKQINRIASEDWFNLLINHDFPTKTISLMGVDLSDRYLHHKTYGTSLDLMRTNLQGAKLKKAQLQGVKLFGSQLQDANLEDAKLQGASLRRAKLQGANLKKTQLQGANLYKAQLQGANLYKAQLQGANLIRAQLQGAYLGDARLQGAYLYEAQLQGAGLKHTQLQGANLMGAQLQGANLMGAQLQGVAMGYAIFSVTLSFEEKIHQQVNENADLEGISKKMLDESEIAALKKTLSLYLGKERVTGVINHIESAKEPVTLRTEEGIETQLGSYSKEDADRWIAEYNEAMGLPANNEEES